MATITPSDTIHGVHIVDPQIHGDERGFFVETYRREWFPQGREMIQGNRGDRQAGAVVGLHYHLHQADYWYVPYGTAPRRAPRPAGRVAHRRRHPVARPRPPGRRHPLPPGVFIPPGVAHGFAALTDMTITYLVDGYYNPTDELGVAWDDPEIAADWGVADPILSGRDQANPRRAEIEPQWRPHIGLRP